MCFLYLTPRPDLSLLLPLLSEGLKSCSHSSLSLLLCILKPSEPPRTLIAISLSSFMLEESMHLCNKYVLNTCVLS